MRHSTISCYLPDICSRRERESVMGSIGEVVPDKINSLPVIDFSRYTAGSAEERLAVSRELVQAFKSVGFVYLLNHGIPNDMVHEAFDWVSAHTLSYPLLRSKKILHPPAEHGRQCRAALLAGRSRDSPFHSDMVSVNRCPSSLICHKRSFVRRRSCGPKPCLRVEATNFVDIRPSAGRRSHRASMQTK